MGCWTGTGCCAPARRPTRSVSNGWWATRCRPLARSLSVGRWCSAARPWCRRSWCTDPGGERPRPEHPAARRWVVGPERDAARPRAGRPGPSQRVAGLWRGRCSGSMVLRRSSVVPPFVVHIKPVGIPQPDYGARHVAALVLIVEPGRQHRIDPRLSSRSGSSTVCATRSAAYYTRLLSPAWDSFLCRAYLAPSSSSGSAPAEIPCRRPS